MDSSRENKRARIERGQFLFLEIFGELFGIDLSGAGAGSDSQISPLSDVTRCRLDLYNDGYPLGMCLVKMGDKQYLIGGLKSNQVEYADDVYELNTDPCRISSSIIREPKHVLKPAGTRIKDPKIALAFNLKGKYYLLHSWVLGYAPMKIPVPFERLDVAADADAAAPPFSCHEVPVPYDNPSVASSHFILDDKLVLFFERYAQIYVFTPPGDEDDDDSGNGKWRSLGYEVYNDSTNSFLSLAYSVPSAGIFLSSDFHVPDPDDATDSLRVLLAFGSILELNECDEANTSFSEEVRAYAISTKTFKAKYYQKLDGVLSDLIPDHAWMKSVFLEDIGKGDQECARRICAIMTSSGYVEDTIIISYLSVSVFDVQLIQPPPPPDMQLIQPPPGPRQFLEVLPIKKLAFEIDHDEKFRHSPVTNAFFV